MGVQITEELTKEALIRKKVEVMQKVMHKYLESQCTLTPQELKQLRDEFI